MRALIDATALGSGRGGDETMLRGLVRGYARTAAPGDGWQMTVLMGEGGEPGAEELRTAGLGLDRMAGRAGARHFGWDLPRYLRRHARSFDVAVTVTHAPVPSPVPVAVMVGDLSFVHLPECYPWATRQRLDRLVRHQARRTAAVLTVSEFCRRDLVSTYGLDPARVHVVPNSVEAMAPLALARRDQARAGLARRGVDGPFFLYLGNLHPRKNVARAIRAFGLARRAHPVLGHHRFVVAGARWWGSGEEQAAAELLGERVVLLGRVDEDERQVLLETADALVYPSRFEGFGLPPLEAMAASTPVVAADAAAIPEVVGPAALLVDPLDEGAMGEAMTRVVTDRALRRLLVDRGHDRVARYHPAATGAALRAALGTVGCRRGARV